MTKDYLDMNYPKQHKQVEEETGMKIKRISADERTTKTPQ